MKSFFLPLFYTIFNKTLLFDYQALTKKQYLQIIKNLYILILERKFNIKKGFFMALAELKSDLLLVEGKIREIYSVGQEYVINGSHSVKNPILKDLQAEAQRLRKRIYRYHGYSTGRTTPDFS